MSDTTTTLTVDKIRFNRLRWVAYLINMREDDPYQKSYKATYMVKKEDVERPASDIINRSNQF